MARGGTVTPSIGVAAVVILTALGDGARRYVVGEFSAIGTNLVIVLPGRSETRGFNPANAVTGTPLVVTLSNGETITIGDDSWRVIVGRGHSPEHACLVDDRDGLLISGDQVLPRISSNVSVYPIEPEADPMSDWLASIDKLRRLVPDDVLVLPSHNEPFTGLHERLDALASGQAEALASLRRALQTPRRVVDCFESLFRRPITEAKTALLGMATGEAQACLNHLRGRGEAVMELDADGVAWWRAA